MLFSSYCLVCLQVLIAALGLQLDVMSSFLFLLPVMKLAAQLFHNWELTTGRNHLRVHEKAVNSAQSIFMYCSVIVIRLFSDVYFTVPLC
jgi:hypothetical protein